MVDEDDPTGLESTRAHWARPVDTGLYLYHLTDPLVFPTLSADFEQEFVASLIRIGCNSNTFQWTAKQTATLMSIYHKRVLTARLPGKFRKKSDPVPSATQPPPQKANKLPSNHPASPDNDEPPF